MKNYYVDYNKNVSEESQLFSQALNDWIAFFELEVWMAIKYDPTGIVSPLEVFRKALPLVKEMIKELEYDES